MYLSNILTRFGGRLAAALMIAAAFTPGFAVAQLAEESKLPPNITGTLDAGQSVALSDDGTIAAVGAPAAGGGTGKVFVFTRTLLAWNYAATLSASDATVGDEFGSAVSISGNSSGVNIAVGAPGHGSGAGAVYVYSGSGAVYGENTNILMSALTSAGALGSAVSIQGFRVAAGAPNATAGKGANAGVAIVFDSIDGGVTFTRSTFRANGGQARVGGHFGASVSLSGSTVLVGAPNYHTGSKQNSGTVFIFVNNGGSWTQQTNIRPANTTDNFAGAAVSLFSNTAAFGAPGNNNSKGAVYVYTRTGTTWNSQATVTAPGGAAGDQFGSSVAQLGSFLVAGSPAANSGGGAAYEFSSTGGTYSLANQLVASDNASGDAFGTSVTVNSGRAGVGAPLNNGAVGDAYVFRFLQPSMTTITCFSSDPTTCVPQEPSLTGVPYTVFVHVDGGVAGTPTGSVNVDDSAGGTCTIAALDGSGNGHCTLTSNFFGDLTMGASYLGDLSFSPSTGTLPHTITGNHLVFNPVPPADVPQGDTFAGTVEVHNGADAVIASDQTTQVTVSVSDSCGNTDVIGQVTVVNGVATFSGVGPKFYTITAGLDISAVANNSTATANNSVNVVVNPDMVFTDGFDDCRL